MNEVEEQRIPKLRRDWEVGIKHLLNELHPNGLPPIIDAIIRISTAMASTAATIPISEVPAEDRQMAALL